MTNKLGYFAGLALLAACATPVPESNPQLGGVGFGGYDAYTTERARRDAELQAMRTIPVPEGQIIAAETANALAATRSPTAGTAPVAARTAEQRQPVAGTAPVAVVAAVEVAPVPAPAKPAAPAPKPVEVVAVPEPVETDADRIARNSDSFQSQAGALPTRNSQGRPNVVAFALSTTHPVGTQMFQRSGRANIDRFNRICAAYPSNDLAQEAFLENGGPERDRKGMDPDGDGFACFWDPSAFRTARGG
ncbi:MAG: hypothetical protein GKR98_02590 [Boseongicola sp.]|nr:MAG: hypothetical protein GKR98_02590 [Boseongicola sp.]